MAYHHFAAPADMTRILAYFLKPGGSLLVTDILETAEGFLPDDAADEVKLAVAHGHGFAEADMRAMFEGAGLVQFEIAPAFSAKVAGKESRLFLARGVKPRDE